MTKSNPLPKKPSNCAPPAPNVPAKLLTVLPSPSMLKIDLAPSGEEALSIIPPNKAGAAAISPFWMVSFCSPPKSEETLPSTSSDN